MRCRSILRPGNGIRPAAAMRTIDWKGWALFVGFIALAFYLNHVTGIG